MTLTPAAAGHRVRAIVAKVAPTFLAFVLTSASAGASASQTVSFITPKSGETISGSVTWAVSADRASRVDFYIDGARRGTEYVAPYVFNGDGNKLDTTTLANGKHVLAVTAYIHNKVARASADVNVLNVPTATPPVSTALPTVTGAAQLGSSLVASTGTWANNPTSYGYQWQQCDASGVTCSGIAGATQASYAPGSAQVGKTLRATVFASNASGSGSATSGATGPVVAPTAGAPTATTAPSVGGTPQVGSSHTASTGNWTNSPSAYAYQWGQCDSAGAACSAIAGATATTFAPTTAQVGKTIRVTLVATNAAGSGSATSAASAAVAAAAGSGGSGGGGGTSSVPQSTAAPSISGTPQSGNTLSAATGTWTNSPTSYSYQWQQCDGSGSACSALSGATGATFALTSSQVGSTLRVAVTASNASGSATASSAATSAVTAAASGTPSAGLGTSLPSRLPQSSGSGGVFYVDGSKGSDSGAGTAASPWKTINKALGTVPTSGSIINVLPGTYSSQGSSYALNFSRSGSTSDPITLQAQTPGTVTITNADPASATVGGWIHGASGLRIKGLTFRILANKSNINASGILIEDSDRIEVDDCTFNEMAETALKVRGGQNDGQTANDVWVIDNVFRSTSSVFAQTTGLAFTSDQYYGSKGSHWIYAGQYGTDSNWEITNGTRRLVITNHVFTGSTAGRDIELGPQAQQGFVVNNTFYGNHAISLLGTSTKAAYAAQGIELYANSSNASYQTGGNVIANNLFDDLDGHAVYGSGPSESGNTVATNLSYNLRNGLGYQGRTSWDYEPLYGSSTIFTVGTNIADGDPRFVNPNAWDFHLGSGSPALGSANAAYTYPYDADGKARPASPAVGAFG
jgi:hypothetical protein